MPPTAPENPALTVVRARAEQVWAAPVAELWLHSANTYLGGARPVDVVELRGPQEVLDALDAITAGAFA